MPFQAVYDAISNIQALSFYFCTDINTTVGPLDILVIPKTDSFLYSVALILLTACTTMAKPLPIADVHLHYNWDQRQITSPEEAVALLHEQNIQIAVISSTPPDMALEIRNAGGGWIIPLYRPYLKPGSRSTWFNDSAVLPSARTALESGKYFGIGEFHLIAGLGPSRKNRILHGLIDLAIEFDLPLLVHIETSSHRYFLPICKQYPKARFLIAHAGGLFDHKEMGALIRQCGNVWTEFSARDSWRYLQSGIVGPKGKLLPGWLKLIKQFPDRFMVGSDPVWPIEYLHSWDEPDTGWLKLGEYLDFHRRWLVHLPPDLQERLRMTNARLFFRLQRKP